jgi:hypothetical protein
MPMGALMGHVANNCIIDTPDHAVPWVGFWIGPVLDAAMPNTCSSGRLLLSDSWVSDPYGRFFLVDSVC